MIHCAWLRVPDLTPVLALGWMGLRSSEARLPLPRVPARGRPLVPSSLGEALSPSLVSVVGSARLQPQSEPGFCLLADAAAILLDEQNKRPCRKFLLTGKLPCPIQVPQGPIWPAWTSAQPAPRAHPRHHPEPASWSQSPGAFPGGCAL